MSRGLRGKRRGEGAVAGDKEGGVAEGSSQPLAPFVALWRFWSRECFTHTRAHTHSRTHSRMHSLIHTCTHTFTHALTYSRMHSRIHTCTHAFTHSHMLSRIHACTRALAGMEGTCSTSLSADPSGRLTSREQTCHGCLSNPSFSISPLLSSSTRWRRPHSNGHETKCYRATLPSQVLHSYFLWSMTSPPQRTRLVERSVGLLVQGMVVTVTDIC